ncbi:MULTISPECIES: EAL domain-containing response regulator [Pseudomonas aeruginosa group]|uniref:Response regulator n=1 Tax=Pseudomonas paraeruginosa TaxID=2994495 RepID=A0A2R3IPX1_9PSED|nr:MULTISPECIES: EAL domain-containing response regulator [Pseudomonas aeruginosa group]VTS15149.1 Heme response regulator hssR [Streptococcus dysgalactiae subsp. equisimilis]AVK03883.1 response regulator [Pseudomonas paraeruginosa]AVR67967.1 diguanylate phosphodiesterase [Pseudomonas paraeruginosa]AWE95266.1 response regulator [Pseudomonas paraeruginosa]KAB0741233.1 EAL domain-containing response regulator [Pseudomonas aeruginosa]
MNLKSYRVLVVEDQPFQREYLLNLLRERGVQSPMGAGDGAEALLCLKRERFDLVLSDLMMPGMDGIQMIQQLPYLKHRPKLALMSSSSQRMLLSASRVAQSLGLSVIDLLPKPTLPKAIGQLLEQLEKCLRQDLEPEADDLPHGRTALLDALHNEQLVTWFQAKKSLHTGRMVGAEALIRWNHPQRGLLLPGCFMSDIDASGLHEALLWRVLEQTLRAQASWRRAGYEIPVSVNLPPHLLDSQDLPDRLCEFVGSRGASAGSLCFELTESSVATLSSNYYAGACRLRMKGFGLAQDDFGQGYSSFFNLVTTPFTELKIDRSLIHGCVEDNGLNAAVTSCIELGHRLNLDVVAEGVETCEELNLLRRLGCDRAQGFLISEAVPAHVFEQQLREDGPSPLA